MHDKVLKHFAKVDPILYAVIKSVGKLQDLPILRGEDYFMDLVESIVSQQLSGKAAATIFGRFKDLFKGRQISPKAVLKIKDEKMRSAGLSYSKIKYIKDLAAKIESKELELEKLDALSDEEVIVQLVKVKGIGKWTAEMFLIFTLRREDVFSHGDLGLNNAIKKIYKLEKYSQSKIEKIVSKWSPYKTYAALILWRSLDNR